MAQKQGLACQHGSKLSRNYLGMTSLRAEKAVRLGCFCISGKQILLNCHVKDKVHAGIFIPLEGAKTAGEIKKKNSHVLRVCLMLCMLSLIYTTVADVDFRELPAGSAVSHQVNH